MLPAGPLSHAPPPGPVPPAPGHEPPGHWGRAAGRERRVRAARPASPAVVTHCRGWIALHAGAERHGPGWMLPDLQREIRPVMDTPLMGQKNHTPAGSPAVFMHLARSRDANLGSLPWHIRHAASLTGESGRQPPARPLPTAGLLRAHAGARGAPRTHIGRPRRGRPGVVVRRLDRGSKSALKAQGLLPGRGGLSGGFFRDPGPMAAPGVLVWWRGGQCSPLLPRCAPLALPGAVSPGTA